MIVECYRCEAKVDAKAIATHTSEDEDDPAPFHASLLECPNCHNTLVGGRWDFQVEPLTRLWPVPQKYVPHQIPEIIRHSLEEAETCFKAGAYNASTVMAGRALEGVCRHFGTAKTYLGPGIRELHKKGVIDARLALWAGALPRRPGTSALTRVASARQRMTRKICSIFSPQYANTCLF